MKESKSSRNRYRIGIIFFVACVVLYYSNSLLFGERDLEILLFGGLALCLFWISAIQHDLYGEEK